MAVKRIVSAIQTDNPAAATEFYGTILDMELVMDQGWIQTYASDTQSSAQINVASEGGSGTAVPALSIEVDNFDEVFKAMKDAGYAIEYGPVDEPWGVRRFYVRDPFERLINILTHI
ncbi:MAG: VOC family protein [Granulosicoccus sp.]|nr:VOC family protein [Granulosicoccus sp.]